MQDEPRPDEILGPRRHLPQRPRDRARPARISRSSRAWRPTRWRSCQRQLTLAPKADAEELARLRALLQVDGDLPTLNRELARRIGDGELDPRDPRP